jgi:hypothetical protein
MGGEIVFVALVLSALVTFFLVAKIGVFRILDLIAWLFGLAIVFILVLMAVILALAIFL